MKKGSVSWEEARRLAVDAAVPLGTERVFLGDCFGRVLAQDVTALENVPPFDRSPYDGYAFRAADTAAASAESPAVLKVLEEIPAGAVPHVKITEGTAVRLMTGAPIPEGADAVTLYEATEFTKEEVKIFKPSKPGENIIYAGEDVKKGQILAGIGDRIDIGLMGTLANQNVESPLVYRQIKAAVISTGSELIHVGEESRPGKIYDSNQFSLTGAVAGMGFIPVRYGTVPDEIGAISAKIEEALTECDAVLLTGGASAGDFDLTPAAMKQSGISILFDGVRLKPGMSCAFGEIGGKLVCSLSGNPSSALTTYLVIAGPALKKAAGYREFMPEEFEVELAEDFPSKSKATRALKGRLDLSGGFPKIRISKSQGNVMISGMIGCDCVAFVPEGSGPLKAGERLRAIRV